MHLSLNQGTTVVREEFQAKTRDVLADRAQFMRKRLADYQTILGVTSIELGSTARLPGDYAAGHTLGATYRLDSMPDEPALQNDLRNVIRAYRSLIYRGGVEGDVETQSDLAVEFNVPSQPSITETRKYSFHRKIERNRTAAKNAKKYHGTACQTCGLRFDERYGPIGEGFIEAHHLKSIATLEEGKLVQYDIAADFAVLCANCHRMIHRTSDPSDLDGFKSLIRVTT